MRRLKELRTKAGLTQKQLADRIGVAQSYLSRLEKDRNKAEQATISLINRIAKALDVEPAELLDDISVNVEKIIVVGTVAVGHWVSEPFWKEERHYVTRTIPDQRYEGAQRFGLEIGHDASAERSVAYFVPIKDIPRPLELNKDYLVQRRNEQGQFELSIRRLTQAKDDSFWLELVDKNEADPADRAPIQYFESSPTVSILARVSSVTQFK